LTIHIAGTLVDGPADKNLTDVLAVYNEANDPDLLPAVGWTPTLFLPLQPTRKVFSTVQAHAGPFFGEGGERD
jgi:hypothetical protein